MFAGLSWGGSGDIRDITRFHDRFNQCLGISLRNVLKDLKAENHIVRLGNFVGSSEMVVFDLSLLKNRVFQCLTTPIDTVYRAAVLFKTLEMETDPAAQVKHACRILLFHDGSRDSMGVTTPLEMLSIVIIIVY
jgi:hypothetical protein